MNCQGPCGENLSQGGCLLWLADRSPYRKCASKQKQFSSVRMAQTNPGQPELVLTQVRPTFVHMAAFQKLVSTTIKGELGAWVNNSTTYAQFTIFLDAFSYLLAAPRVLQVSLPLLENWLPSCTAIQQLMLNFLICPNINK